MNLTEQLAEIAKQATVQIKTIETENELFRYQAFLLGKKSTINAVLQQLKNADHETRMTVGRYANELKKNLKQQIINQQMVIAQVDYERKIKKDQFDLSLPGAVFAEGQRHLLSLVLNKIITFFQHLGYQVKEGSHLTTIDDNFTKLNIDVDHPSRSLRDTFYLNKTQLLRTHCTNITAQWLEQLATSKTDWKNSSGLISHGVVFRRDDDDATHSHQFYQIDGFCLGYDVSFANLKWTLTELCRFLFGMHSKIRLRPSYFPFTNASVEVDVSCYACFDKATNWCALCKNSRYLEILGAGLIAPEVYEACSLQVAGLNGWYS